MLESGYTVFDCQIVKLLVENDVYQSYLVKCADSTSAKLILILPDPLFDQKQKQEFLDYTSWLSSQTFPRIGSLLKAGNIVGKPACLYSSTPGVPLTQIIDTDFSVRQAIELIKEIALCLSGPHNAGLCHGNLSPETVYVDDNSPYLVDFSLCQLINLDYHSGIDPQYTSPEQVRNELPGTAADIYNLGCLFYRLLTGEKPFFGATAFTIAKNHLQGDFPRLPEKLSLLQPLLDSQTKVVAEERISIEELIDRLTQLLTQKEIDQLQLSVPTDDQQVDELPADDGASLFDEAMDSYEVATRIEARFKKHAETPPETIPAEITTGEEEDVTDGLDQVDQEEKSGFGRFALVLLLGVVIGSGLYFLFYRQAPVAPPMVDEQTVKINKGLTVGLDRGLRLWQEEDFNGAEAEFKQTIANYPDDPRAYNNLSAFYAAQGNYDQARDYLEQALATDESYATIYRNLGSVYTEMARGSYGRALQLDKEQALILLPVFSSQGTVILNPVTGDTVAMQEQSSETIPISSQLAEAGGQIASASVATDNLSDTPVIVSVEPEKLEIVAAVESLPIEKEEPLIVVAEVEQAIEIESVDTVPAIAKHEEGDMFLQRWAQAWSDQDVDGYLAFYADEFVPSGDKTRQVWEAQRRSRLAKPKEIIVSLVEFQLQPQENDHLQIEVIQSYESDVFADKTRKLFDLQPTENSWKIIREQSLGVIR